MSGQEYIYPVYFLYGAENLLIEKEVEALLDRVVSKKERGLNLHIFRGDENTAQEILQSVKSLPMFSRYRFVLVKEADQLSEDSIERILNYIRTPSNTTCLVICGHTAGGWKGYLKEIEKVGKVMEFPRLKGKALVSWIRRRIEERGKKITPEAIDYLTDVVGDHLNDLENNIEKVILGVGQKRVISLSDVEEIASEVKLSTIFDLTEAIGERNLEKALKLLDKALESKFIQFRKDEDISKRRDDPVPLLLSMMAKQYWNIWKIKEMISSKRDEELPADKIGMNVWSIRKLVQHGRNFSESSLREGILKCHQTDLDIKKGRGPKELLMEKLIIDLCQPNNPTSLSRKE